MTGFDILVLMIVGIAAAGGFMRGLTQEVLSLAAWILAAAAIHYLHTLLTEGLREFLGYGTTTSLFAFVLLLLIPYAAMKLIAGNVGKAAKGSVMGPIDRVLGFGFGALKGALIVVIAFSMLALGYDAIWSYKGRPSWMTAARSYPAVNASADGLVEMVSSRRARQEEQSSVSE